MSTDRRSFCRYALISAAALLWKPATLFASVSPKKPRMAGKCQVEVVRCQCFDELQCRYLSDPEAGPCQRHKVGDKFEINPLNLDSFAHGEHICPNAWRALKPYVMAALSQGETTECAPALSDNQAIVSCPDGTRPVIFKVTAL